MLTELVVTDLGIIAQAELVLGPGMTVLSGETGAGKTLLVDALGLLVGERADAGQVRTGAEEATVEGRFVIDDVEHVVRRVVPREGRSRAYLDGHVATAAALAETLSPNSRMVSALGPIKAMPASAQASANSGLSDKKP